MSSRQRKKDALTEHWSFYDYFMEKSKKQRKVMIFSLLDHIPGAQKRTRPAESDFDIRFERKLIFLGQLLIQSIEKWNIYNYFHIYLFGGNTNHENQNAKCTRFSFLG